MPKKSPKATLEGSLSGYEDIFRSTIDVATAEETEAISITDKADPVESIPNGKNIVMIELNELHPPEDHPFKVKHDAAMKRLIKSIEESGVLEPGIVRPRVEGGYELVSGNRRKMACSLLDMPTMPVIIRDMDDDTASIMMVDCNLAQREVILPSEKAKAYKIKMDALSHKGVKDEKQSVEILMEQTGESRSQIFRLLRLTELIDELSDKLDTNRLSFSPAVALSHLSVKEQKVVDSAMEHFGIKPSVSQADKIKKLKQAGELDEDKINEILSEDKANPKNKNATRQYSEYFPSSYTAEQMEAVIIELLSNWKSTQDFNLEESA